MCGIFCLVNKKKAKLNKNKLFETFKSINLRGSEDNHQVYIDKELEYSGNFIVSPFLVLHASRFATQGTNKFNQMPIICKKILSASMVHI